MSGRLSKGLCTSGVIAGTISLGVAPWFLGGAIPHAGLLIQAGAVLSSLLLICGLILRRDTKIGFPITSLPMLGFCLIGIVQLLPGFEHPALGMHHAVQSNVAEELPAVISSVTESGGVARSVMPAETRSGIAQWLALSLLVLVVFQASHHRSDVILIAGILVVSGCAMSALALSQQFGAVETIVGNQWKVSPTKPFGCFVNPNNAAGWLMMCLAMALLLAGLAFRIRGVPGVRSSARWSSTGDRIWMAWVQFVGRVADATTSQVLAVTAVVLLIVAIAATLSRAGIVAAAMGLTAFAVSRFAAGRWLGAAVSLTLLTLMSCGFLVMIDLDTIVLSELQTLKDPVSDTTGRLLHWSDSLQSVRDFPWLGTGLGAYRYATLPYQRHYTGRWFQRADNQYVELLVETGLAGFLCLSLFAALVVGLIRKSLFLKSRGELHDAGLTSWLGSAVVFAGVSIAAAAFFDYGISLAPVAGALLVLVTLLERQVTFVNADAIPGRWSASQQKKDHEPSSESARSVNRTLILCVWTSLAASLALLIPDTLAACRVYDATVPAARLLDRPDVETLMASGDSVLAALQQARKSRPDDLQAKRMEVLFLEMMMRTELIRRFSSEQPMTPQQAQSMFTQLDSVRMADRVLSDSLSPEQRRQAQSTVRAALEKYPFDKVGAKLLESSGFVLSTATHLAAIQIVLDDRVAAFRSITHSRFAEPHAARGLFSLGHLLLQMGFTEQCRSVWEQSIAASESSRSMILLETARVEGVETAMEWFAPSTYESCVRSALETGGNESLRTRLLELSDGLWRKQNGRLTPSLIQARSLHLESMGRTDEALEFLSESLTEDPWNLTLRKSRAQMLERAGKNAEAYDEWLRLQSFGAESSEAEAAMERLIRLPPVTE